MKKQIRLKFYNQETHELFYTPLAKRGNFYYAVKNDAVCNDISEAVSGIIFDEPVLRFRNIWKPDCSSSF